jgi:hypothetical protein
MAINNLTARRYPDGNQVIDDTSVTVPFDGSKVEWPSLSSASPSGAEFLYDAIGFKVRVEVFETVASVLAALK